MACGSSSPVTIKSAREIVTTYEQLLHAYAIRSICFMEEHGVKAQQTFDGNDYQATHMIVYAGDEPIGTLRIRWFKDFAKLERTAFREAYRNTHVLKAFAYFVFDHVARKGYDKVITHAQPKYARLWRITFGFKNAEGKKPVYFDGHAEPYIELVKELTPPAQRNLGKHGSRPFCSGPRASGMRRRSTRRSRNQPEYRPRIFAVRTGENASKHRGLLPHLS